MSEVQMTGVLIDKLERYEPVPEAERDFLEQAAARVVEYETGQSIAQEGQAPSESCLVLEAFVGRVKILPGGTRQILAIHIPGDFCDLHSFVLKKLDHDIEALSRCKVAKVPHAQIKEMTERFPRLTRALWRDVAIDGAIHREWMIGMGRRTAYERIAHLFCEMLLRLRSVGLVGDDNSYDLPLTQQQLGDVLGLSGVHVNRMLQALRRGGLIVSHGKRITIPDVDALTDAADFDPTYLHVHGSPGN